MRVEEHLPALANVRTTAQLSEQLADGVVLCEFARSLAPNLITRISTGKGARKAIASQNNTRMFLNACKEVGVPESHLFNPGDLYHQYAFI